MESNDINSGVKAIKKLNIWIYILIAVYFISLISISLYFNFSRNDIRVFFVAILLLIPIFGIYFLIYFNSKDPEIVELRKNSALSKKVADEIEIEGKKRAFKAYSIGLWIRLIITIVAILLVIILFFLFRHHF